MVQGITVGSLAGAMAEALQSKSSSSAAPVAALSTTANNESTIKQGRLTSSEDDQIPFVIGRPVYVIIVEHGGQVYNLQHEVLRRQEEDRPFDFEKTLSELPKLTLTFQNFTVFFLQWDVVLF